ncbi:hypothetical protein Tco_0427421 [Tanacetum coccineum]
MEKSPLAKFARQTLDDLVNECEHVSHHSDRNGDDSGHSEGNGDDNEHSEGNEDDSEHGEGNEDTDFSDNDSQDSDYIMDEENYVEEVEVDM